jgi:hypothetical protein
VSEKPFASAASILIERRSLLSRAGSLGLAATAAAFLPGTKVFADDWDRDHDRDDIDDLSGDKAQEIFTAALIAEDLASTFYYNALIGTVIADPNLAGPGGTATSVSVSGNVGNVDYFRAALSEEIAHANLMRALIGQSESASDPVQTFYLPSAAFETLDTFTAVLDALESAFIGAYLLATIEFAQMAADTKARFRPQRDAAGKPYSSRELEYFAQVAASIMGVEAEHRVLGRGCLTQIRQTTSITSKRTDYPPFITAKRQPSSRSRPFSDPVRG